jgi:hypothetical protein
MTEKFDSKALQIKLLKFIGFKPYDELYEYWIDEGLTSNIKGLRTYKDSVWCLPLRSMPKLVTSLDAQFKYLWTEIRKRGFMIRYQYSELRDNDTGKIISD